MKNLLCIAIIFCIIGCSKNKPTETYTACSGFQNSNTYAPPSFLTSNPPLLPTSQSNAFYATDGFSLSVCEGVTMFYPGVAYQSKVYKPGDTLIVYIYSASFNLLYFAPETGAEVTTDIRLGLYDVVHFSPEPGQGTLNSGNNGSVPTMVATFTFAPPYGSSPAIILNQLSTAALNTPVSVDFGTHPLVLTVSIPSNWTGLYQIGASFQFNHSGNGGLVYDYTLHGAVDVQP